MNAVVVILRIRKPDAERPFRVAGSIGRVPVIPVAATVATLVMIPRLKPTSLALGAALVGAGALLALIAKARTRALSPGA